MREHSTHHVTELLASAGDGDAEAQEQLWSLIYKELHNLAQRQMIGEAPGNTFQTTVLVHEAYIRLFGNQEVVWKNRRHFFGSAARAMRQILVDSARKRGRKKRGSGKKPIALTDDAAGF